MMLTQGLVLDYKRIYHSTYSMLGYFLRPAVLSLSA